MTPTLGHTMALLWGATGTRGAGSAGAVGMRLGMRTPFPAGLASVMNGMSFLPAH